VGGDGVRRRRRRERAWELFRLINPIHHGDSAGRDRRYKVEPYVVAADVYTNPQHAGRGGWTWYTGSARGCTA
jgi:cyclic beta-1,2-glucan synthetase